MKFVKSVCMAAGFPCQNYREGVNLLCATCGDHIDFHANGYWLDGKFELIVLPFVSSVGVVAPTLPTPILPTPVLKARINESSLPKTERNRLFSYGSKTLASAPLRTPVTSTSVIGKAKPVVKPVVAQVLLTHVEKLILMMDRD
jgi:hypothetical protein